MKLTLSMTNADPAIAVQDRSRSWIDSGGAIGRFEGNDWVLPDPLSEISRVHAKIYFSNKTFFVEDLSTNGVFVGSRERRIERAPYALSDGDTLFIGHYQIAVEIAVAMGESESQPQVGGSLNLPGTDLPEPLPEPVQKNPSAAGLFSSVDGLFQTSQGAKSPVVISNDIFALASSADTQATPEPLQESGPGQDSRPAATGPANLIPENWWDEPIAPSAVQSPVAASHKPATQPGPEEDICDRQLSAQKFAAQSLFRALLDELNLKQQASLTVEESDALFQRLYNSRFKPEYENKLAELRGDQQGARPECTLDLIL